MTKRILAALMALLLALSALPALADADPVEINKQNFPDAAFRSYVKKSFDKDKDGALSAEEIDKVKVIELFGDRAVKNLKGIELFPQLTELAVCFQKIKSLDVSKNPRLKTLACDYNPSLSTLKLGQQKKLYSMTCTYTALKTVDIGGCPKLIDVLKKLVYATRKTVMFGESGSTLVAMNKGTNLVSGKKTLMTYGKPTSIAFSKPSATVSLAKAEKGVTLYQLGIYLTTQPGNKWCPVTFTSSNDGLLTTDASGYDPWLPGLKGGKVTLTARCGGKTATIEITIK